MAILIMTGMMIVAVAVLEVKEVRTETMRVMRKMQRKMGMLAKPERRPPR